MKTAILAFLVGVLGSYSVHAQGSGSHGGDGLVIEFTGTARNIRAAMVPLGALAGCPTEAQFEEVIDQTKVISEPTVLINYIEHDAKNDSDAKLITLSRARLINLSDPLAYVNLVMHEYFGILKLEGTNDTSVSQLCLSQIRSHGIDVNSLIYKISPITTFEQQFSIGRAALDCRNNYGDYRRILAVCDEGKKDLCDVTATIRLDDGLFTNMRGKAVSGYSSSKILKMFSTEYSVSNGSLNFRFSYLSQWKDFAFESLDHVEWNVRITSKTGNYGENSSTQSFSSCKPVYFTSKPIIKE